MPYRMSPTPIHPETLLNLHVVFGMHTFTRRIEPDDDPRDRYSDDRESRTFCQVRYGLSKLLPGIVQELDQRQCGFARSKSGFVNYLTVDVRDAERYGVFFNMRALRKYGPHSMELAILSAYPFERGKPEPSLGRIRFRVIVGHAFRGTKPRIPLK